MVVLKDRVITQSSVHIRFVQRSYEHRNNSALKYENINIAIFSYKLTLIIKTATLFSAKLVFT